MALRTKTQNFFSSNQWFKNKVYLLYLFYDLSETKINDKKRREFRTKNDSKKFCRNRNLIEKKCYTQELKAKNQRTKYINHMKKSNHMSISEKSNVILYKNNYNIKHRSIDSIHHSDDEKHEIV